MPRSRAAVLAHFPEYARAEDLEVAVRAAVRPYQYDEEFDSALVSDLIERAHYYCAPKGLRPQWFRKRRPAGRRPDPARNYDFEGWFPGEIGWHSVSWLKCIKGRTWERDLYAALRREISVDVIERQRRFPTCERCQLAPATETDHVAPEFADLVETALTTMSEDEIRSAFANFDWLAEERFQLPDEHVVRQRFLVAHASAVLQAVCAPCHVANAEDRKAAGTAERRTARTRR